MIVFFNFRHVVFGRTGNLSALKKPAASPVKIPAHKGGIECVVCLENEAEHATSYVCGHYSVCEECYPQFAIENHTNCPKCKADRVYQLIFSV
jgi:hypothetical protein